MGMRSASIYPAFGSELALRAIMEIRAQLSSLDPRPREGHVRGQASAAQGRPLFHPLRFLSRTSVNCSRSLDHPAGLFPGLFDQGGPSAADRLASSIRDFVADRDRRSLASHFRRASSRLMNQCAFKHSARNLPLKDSMKALSVGFPGREKSSMTPRW